MVTFFKSIVMPYGRFKRVSLLLLFCCHLCSGNNRKREVDDVKSASRRFIFDSNHKFSGWASWEQYAACSTQCVSGYEKQTKECCDTGDNRLCYSIPWDQLKSHVGTCPNDGQWGAWGTWTTCSFTCGRGTQFRKRSCLFDLNRPHGNNCPAGGGNEIQYCMMIDCPVDGVWLMWSQWTSCSVTCGGGTESRLRNCYFPPTVPKGNLCQGQTVEQQTCSTNICPVDGQWGAWGAWATCSVTCGHGTQFRKRPCVFDVTGPQGDNCPARGGNETQSCTMRDCPVDGIWLTWSPWTACSVTCGGGKQRRHRECHFPPHVPQGQYCQGQSIQQVSCETSICPGSCFKCLGSPLTCERLNFASRCPLGKPFCINTLDNFKNASRTLDMRCGTRGECKRGWFDKFSKDSTCTRFRQDYIYTNQFHCEFCCDTDNCSQLINPPAKWHP